MTNTSFSKDSIRNRRLCKSFSRNFLSSLIITAELLLFFTACNKKATLPAIVATNFVCFDAARAVLGDASSIKLLIKPGTEVHNYDPSISDIMAVENSSLLIYIGGESDEWVRRILSTNSGLRTLRLMDYITPIKDDDGDYDEHIWLNPINEIVIIKAVSDSLSALNPIDKSRVASYIAKISALDKDLESLTKNLKTPIVVADRFPFAYFTARYKLPYIAAFNGCAASTEPNTKTILNMCKSIKNMEIPAAFYIELSNHKMASMIEKECGVELRALYSMQNVTQGDFDSGETYITLMKKNIESLSVLLK